MKYPDIPGRPRSSAGFAQVGKYLYWAAGHLGQFHYYGRCHFSKEFHRLDLETGKWTRLADFPVPAQGFRMVGYGDFVYAFGGFVYEGDGDWPVRSTDVVRRYNTGMNVWEDIGKLNAPRSSNIAGLVGSQVYLIGGWNGFSQPDPADESNTWRSKPNTFHETIEVFNLDENQVVEEIPLGISPRRAFTSVTVGDEITVACGIGPRGFSDLKTDIRSFSTSTRKWTKLFDTTLGLFSPGIAWPGHSPYIVGGLYVAPDHTYYEEFDSISTFYPHGGGTWEILAHLSSTRSFAETAIWNGSLIVIGGHSGNFPVSSVETFNAQRPGALIEPTRLQNLTFAFSET